MLRKLAEFFGRFGLGALLGFSSATIAVTLQAHVFFIYGAGLQDTKLLFVLVAAAVLIVVTAVMTFAHLRNIFNINDRTIGAVGFLLTVIPALYFGYEYAQTLDETSPGIADLLSSVEEYYPTAAIEDESEKPKSAFDPSSSSRLPQIE